MDKAIWTVRTAKLCPKCIKEMEAEYVVYLTHEQQRNHMAAASLDLVYLRPAQEAPAETERLFGTAQRTTVWCVFGRALRRA